MIPLAVALCALVIGCDKKSNTIKIGQAVALTGDNSVWGQSEKKALEMEIAKINDKGGVLGKKIELISYDTRADATEGVNVTKRLVSDGVCAIIGPGQSGVAIAMTSLHCHLGHQPQGHGGRQDQRRAQDRVPHLLHRSIPGHRGRAVRLQDPQAQDRRGHL
jgi:hypothetical protein